MQVSHAVARTHSGFFLHKKIPSEEGICLCEHLHCITAWCRVPPGEFGLVPPNPRILAYDHQRDHTIHQSPLRTGGFTMQFFSNKFSSGQTTFNRLNCEVCNIPVERIQKKPATGGGWQTRRAKCCYANFVTGSSCNT